MDTKPTREKEDERAAEHDAFAEPARAVARDCIVAVSGASFLADPTGVLVEPHERVMIVSDLHLEKGSSFAARGVLIPPYDTMATLARLAAAIARHTPRLVVALGDSFHDRDAHARLPQADRETLAAMQAGRDWIWIAGNHDPVPPESCGGEACREFKLGAIVLRHEPSDAAGEICGHLHPTARIATRAQTMTRRCFVSDGQRLVMPAFGAYTGGLNVRDGAFARLFFRSRATAFLLGEGRVHAIPLNRCSA